MLEEKTYDLMVNMQALLGAIVILLIGLCVIVETWSDRRCWLIEPV